MDSVARGTLINLVTRLAGVALVLAITAVTARIGTETQGAFALFTSIEGVLLALLSGFGIALARRVSHHGEQPRALVSATVLACVAWAWWPAGAVGAVGATGRRPTSGCGCWRWVRPRCCWRPTCKACGWAKGAWHRWRG
jgi:O-antigen/teichoic acid export membrane protein